MSDGQPPFDPQPFFEALADPLRRRILALLLAVDEHCVCDLHGALDASQPKVSRHLAVLREAGLVLARRDGVWMRYRIHPQLPAWALRVLIHMKDGMGEGLDLAAPSACDPRDACRPGDPIPSHPITDPMIESTHEH